MSDNYELTQRAIPGMVFGNTRFFIEKIALNPESIKSFIQKDAYKQVCDNLRLEYKEQPVQITESKTDSGWTVYFARFNEEFIKNDTDSLAVAFAIKDDELRYFTFEQGVSVASGETIWFTSELTPENDRFVRKNYGSVTDGGAFAEKVLEILR